MTKNKEPVATNDGQNIRTDNQVTMNQFNTNQNTIQYLCSFCWRELPTGSTRFNGIGTCPRCYRLAHHLVNGLRTHRQNYFSNLGVSK